ncbi:iron-containing alcohol dehydrogenase [uncultured Maritimibacter sp.]|uniref:iron-containing alcohol dehydrogenase n=1 Tax=uncultured Maritimibacter sp. TaxID=991866 RepID=UPI00262BCB49|nr:iron-containing alcohol dehydrogenase [uncultured Maritimibacter sp.]
MSVWSFRNPVDVRFGAGRRGDAAALIAGKSVLAVGTKRGRGQCEADALLAPALAGAASVTWVDSVMPNPGLADVQAEVDQHAGQSFDLVLAFGGGSAMDAAKALAACLAPGIDTRDLAQLIARPGELVGPSALPIVALATTSGTGSEVTPFATIWDHANAKKLSLASPHLFSRVAIVDPELTHGIPMAATLSTGLDAMNQAFESAWNRNRSPVTMAMAARAIALAFDALPVLAQGENAAARAQIAEASLLAGLCISQTRTAICHATSYPLTAHFDLAHGYACAFSMKAVARLVDIHAPEIFDDLVALGAATSRANLLAKLDAVLAASGLAEALNAHLPDAAALQALASEMHTPGRADNFPISMDGGRLEALLADSRAV